MPDITMCFGEQCAIKNNCYRYMASPSKYMQSYFVVPPCNKEELPFKCTNIEYCNYYWSNKEGEDNDES